MIDAAISEKYNLVRHGSNGIEVQRDNEVLAIFNFKPTDEENWCDAIAWCTHLFAPPPTQEDT